MNKNNNNNNPFLSRIEVKNSREDEFLLAIKENLTILKTAKIDEGFIQKTQEVREAIDWLVANNVAPYLLEVCTPDETISMLIYFHRHKVVNEDIFIKMINAVKSCETKDSIIHVAIKKKCIEIIPQLFLLGVNINIKNQNEQNVLHCLFNVNSLYSYFNDSIEHCINFVYDLMRAGCKINSVDKNGQTPVHCALERGYVDIVKLFKHLSLDRWTNPVNLGVTSEFYNSIIKAFYVVDYAGKMPLHYAVEQNSIEIAEHLILQGNKINKQDKGLNTPLHFVKSVEMAKLLIANNKAYASVLNNEKKAPLSVVMDRYSVSRQNEDFELIRYLLVQYPVINQAFQKSLIELRRNMSCNLGEKQKFAVLINDMQNFFEQHVNYPERIGYIFTYSDYFLAALFDDLSLIKGSFKNLIDSAVDSNYSTALHIACIHNSIQVVEHLLTNGANVNAKDEHGWTPLHKAVKNEYFQIMERLIVAGADVNAKNKHDITPLHIAIQKGNLPLIESLVNQGANIDVKSKQSISLSRWIPDKNYFSLLDLIVVDNKFNTKNDQGWTLLHQASYYGCLSIIQYLVNKGMNVNVQDASDCTPLHVAILKGDFSIVEFLIDQGADVYAKDGHFNTLFHFASLRGDLSIVQLLFDKQNINAKNENNIDARNSFDVTALHMASQRGCLSVVDYLITKGLNVNVIDNGGYTPLHLASLNGRLTTVEYLISKGANIHAKTKDGITSLHLASQNGVLSIVELLVFKGANIEERNLRSFTPLYLATEHQHEAVIDFLITKGANVNIKDCDGNTPLHKASQEGHLLIVKLLVDKGADIHAVNNNNYTAVDLAFSFFNLSVIKYFREKDVTINMGFNNVFLS